MPNRPVLVDTSAWIHALRKESVPAVKSRMDELLKDNMVVTTAMIKLEILGGTKTDKEFKRLKTYLDALEDLEISGPQWERAYELSFNLRRKGLTIPYTDVLIAACALSKDLVLMHADTHFDAISKHVGLKVESFVRAARSFSGHLKATP
jgi:predicted nucleic acid-binding protein